MNITNQKWKFNVAALLLVFASFGLQAGGHYSRPRDIDRALLITDIVLRALIPTQTVYVEPQPVVTYTTPVYQTTTVVTTPTTVITPVYSQPVYSQPVYYAPTFHYSRPARYDHRRAAPRWYNPPRHQRQPSRMQNHAPQGRGNHRR